MTALSPTPHSHPPAFNPPHGPRIYMSGKDIGKVFVRTYRYTSHFCKDLSHEKYIPLDESQAALRQAALKLTNIVFKEGRHIPCALRFEDMEGSAIHLPIYQNDGYWREIPEPLNGQPLFLSSFQNAPN